MKINKLKYGSKTFFKDLTKELMGTGFAIVSNAPVNYDIIREAYTEWEGFFTDPKKFDHLRDPKRQGGYFPLWSENAKDQKAADKKEFYHLFANDKLPSLIPTEYTLILSEQLQQLGGEILAGIDAFYTMDLSGTVESTFKIGDEPKKILGLSDMAYNSPSTLLRTLHYPPLSEDERRGGEGYIRASAHEDINLITLLPVSTAPGLQVQDNDGDWHDVGGDPGDIVVNVGDMLTYMTNGYVRSTTHRVIVPAGYQDKSRYSLALFIHPKPETIIADGKTAKEFLVQRLREIGLIK